MAGIYKLETAPKPPQPEGLVGLRPERRFAHPRGTAPIPAGPTRWRSATWRVRDLVRRLASGKGWTLCESWRSGRIATGKCPGSHGVTGPGRAGCAGEEATRTGNNGAADSGGRSAILLGGPRFHAEISVLLRCNNLLKRANPPGIFTLGVNRMNDVFGVRRLTRLRLRGQFCLSEQCFQGRSGGYPGCLCPHKPCQVERQPGLPHNR